MSTVELIEELKRLGNAQRLAIIEAASRLVREELAVDEPEDRRLREQAMALRDAYEPGGELTEWISLDAEDMDKRCIPITSAR